MRFTLPAFISMTLALAAGAAFAQRESQRPRPATRPGRVETDIDRAVERLGPKIKFIEPKPDPEATIPLPWAETGVADMDERMGRSAIVKLRNSAHALHAVWVIEPEEAESEDARPWRVPLGPGEAQTIRLQPGRWKVSLRAGSPGAAPLPAAPRSFNFLRERAYESTFDREIEEIFRAALRKRDDPFRRPVRRNLNAPSDGRGAR